MSVVLFHGFWRAKVGIKKVLSVSHDRSSYFNVTFASVHYPSHFSSWVVTKQKVARLYIGSLTLTPLSLL